MAQHKQQQQTISGTLGQLSRTVRSLLGLYIEKARLKTTEKLSILLSTIAFAAVITAVGLVCLVFISIGVGHLLATTVAPHIAYLIVAAFYVAILAVILCLRRQLFIDPITRLMSRLIVDEPGYELTHPDRTASDKGDEPKDKDYDDIARRLAKLIREADNDRDFDSNNEDDRKEDVEYE